MDNLCGSAASDRCFELRGGFAASIGSTSCAQADADEVSVPATAGVRMLYTGKIPVAPGGARKAVETAKILAVPRLPCHGASGTDLV
jgi:hypothetical protein